MSTYVHRDGARQITVRDDDGRELLAAETAEEHNASPGRLCVMLSRHMTHLVWVCDDRWRTVVKASPPGEPALATSKAVRESLDGLPRIS